MYAAIKKYCENERQNGLYLIDMPTGFGKTYNVIQYIFDASINEANKDKRYFFITTLKKNLPSAELEDRFKKAGMGEFFREKFLFIDSNVDCVIEHLTDEVKRNVPYDIAKTDEFKEFVRNVEFLQNLETDSKLKAFAGSISENLRMKTEPAFRRMIQNLLAKEYSSVEKRILAIKTDKRWQWLGNLYPAVFTKDKQIIFMSVDKFLSRNATIVEPSYMFYNADIINNAIIFIDEFDQTKDTVLKNIIQNGLRDKIDYVELFGAIYSSLNTNSFPVALTTPSQKRKSGEWADQSLQGLIDDIRDKADTIYRDFSLQFSHRTTETTEASSHNFLFQDHQFHSVLDGKKAFITTQCDKKQRINAITFSATKPENERNNIQVLLGKLRGFITWFLGTTNILAINYMQRKQEMRKNGDDEFTFESAVRSVLSLFRLNDDYIDYLTSQILISSHKVKGDIEPSEFDQSFYENGFRFYAFEDDTTHDMQSKIMMCSFQNTPEKTLLRFCEKAKVIGISATATIDTVLGNYDLNYLKAKMQVAYEEMAAVDRERLHRVFEDSQKGYKEIAIQRELLGDFDYSKYCVDSWNQVFSSSEVSRRIYDRLLREQPESKDQNNYNKERYLRISLAYKRFLTHNDIQSFLCVLTKHPKHGDYSLDLDTLYEIFRVIGLEQLPEFDTRKSVALLDGDEFETKKNDVIQRLENGEKIFVISVYQTIGAGQNLQYKVPSTIKDSLVQINERNSAEKDFDAIYLDKPTNLLVNFLPNQAIEEEDFVKALFQYEFLQESAELSTDEAAKHIKNAFRHYISDGTAKKDFVSTLRDTQSVRMLSTRYIIQAIGRICRTGLKNKNIYVYADRRISDSIDISVTDNRALNPEFLALIDLVKQTEYRTPEMRSLEHEADLKSARVNKDIRNMLEEEWNDRRIKKWQALRDLTLRHPTMSQDEVDNNFAAYNYYIQLPNKGNRYYYYQQEDFNNIGVSFVQNIEHRSVLSEEGTKLVKLMEFPAIRSMFEKNGYATRFEPNKYMMSPPLWNNVYKGALGEVVGKFLFDRVLKVQLDEITNPDAFELFDYKVGSLPVYLDFKNWHESTDFEWNQQISKIFQKAEKSGCKCAIIANIITERNDYQIHSTHKDGIEIIVIPALLNGKNHNVNPEAWKKIKECLERYGN